MNYIYSFPTEGVFMKKMITSLLLTMMSQFASANTCDQPHVQKRVLLLARYLETLNGGGHPITTEVYSYNSQERAYAVIFSYSGVQNVWQVRLDKSGCQISAIAKQ